jgi:glycosyltransferase involved in cell wall biosynthesis
MTTTSAPHLTIVIPVYNEEGILRGSVLELEEKLVRFGWSYELLLCENGSRDRTVEIGREIEAAHPAVRMLSVGEPNYGRAMRQGILEARGTYVICDEIDLLDTEFYARAMALLERSDTDLVVGSKAMVGSNDQRPLFRRAATRVYNGMLRVVCHFPGTDTHGLKALRGAARDGTPLHPRPRRLRERVRHPRPPRGQARARDPVRRAREAPALDPPRQARPSRAQERGEAGRVGPQERLKTG